MMKRLLLNPALPLALAMLPMASLWAAPAGAATPEAALQVRFEGVKETTGAVLFLLYDNEQAYAGATGKPMRSARVPVSADAPSQAVSGLKPGRYAIKAFHDVDSDGRMSMNPMGMPTEPYGFSNDAEPRFGPAPWSAAAFEVKPGDNAHTITLR